MGRVCCWKKKEGEGGWVRGGLQKGGKREGGAETGEVVGRGVSQNDIPQLARTAQGGEKRGQKIELGWGK